MRSVCYRREPAIPMSKSGRQGLFLTLGGPNVFHSRSDRRIGVPLSLNYH